MVKKGDSYLYHQGTLFLHKTKKVRDKNLSVYVLLFKQYINNILLKLIATHMQLLGYIIGKEKTNKMLGVSMISNLPLAK